jgi:hypothetical protein
MMKVVLSCNTVSSVTFGGTVRSRNVIGNGAGKAARYDVECDDWRTVFNRRMPMRAYSSVGAHSIVRDLVDAFSSSFSAAGVNSLRVPASATAWDRLTIAFTGDCYLSQALDSVVAACAPSDPVTDPIRWWIDPARVVSLEGPGSTNRPTVTLDDADLDLQRFEMGIVAEDVVTRAHVWCGSTYNVFPELAGAGVQTVGDGTLFGALASLDGDNELYSAIGSDLCQVRSINGNAIYITSLNAEGVLHAALGVGAATRPVVRVQSIVSQNRYSSLTDTGSGVFEARVDLPLTTADAVVSGQPAGNSLMTFGSDLAYLRVVTCDSRAWPGGRLVVSLTAAYGYQGVYSIQRVRIAGFDRGDTIRPLYYIEAGVMRETRIDDIL